jgi:hypothetical protein
VRWCSAQIIEKDFLVELPDLRRTVLVGTDDVKRSLGTCREHMIWRDPAPKKVSAGSVVKAMVSVWRSGWHRGQRLARRWWSIERALPAAQAADCTRCPELDRLEGVQQAGHAPLDLLPGANVVRRERLHEPTVSPSTARAGSSMRLFRSRLGPCLA